MKNNENKFWGDEFSRATCTYIEYFTLYPEKDFFNIAKTVRFYSEMQYTFY